MDRHRYPLMVIVNAAYELGEMALDLSQRKRSHSQKYDQKAVTGQTGGTSGTLPARDHLHAEVVRAACHWPRSPGSGWSNRKLLKSLIARSRELTASCIFPAAG